MMVICERKFSKLLISKTKLSLAYITHNATEPPTVQLELQMCYVSSSSKFPIKYTVTPVLHVFKILKWFPNFFFLHIWHPLIFFRFFPADKAFRCGTVGFLYPLNVISQVALTVMSDPNSIFTGSGLVSHCSGLRCTRQDFSQVYYL